MRIKGLPESVTENVDEKIMKLCNDTLELDPPLELSEIEVSHRLPRRQDTSSGGPPATPPGPRGVIIKFSSRRSKARVMATRKKLKNIHTNVNTKDSYPYQVFFMDDLTGKRAKLAYKARELKKKEKIADTWVYDSKIFIKDNYSRISPPIRGEKDLAKYDRPPGRDDNG